MTPRGRAVATFSIPTLRQDHRFDLEDFRWLAESLPSGDEFTRELLDAAEMLEAIAAEDES